MAPLGAILELRGPLPALLELRPASALGLGLGLYAAGLVGTLWSQLSMGDSWRVGVRRDEHTALITRGPYRTIRNPIYSFMIVALAGLVLLTPNVVALLALLTLVAAVEIHVKLVEEPHLARTHGDAYASYRARTGRFVPGIGR
jgi:protein-S-isoprenylcysteine O-methyltransferase Ste14